MKTPYLLLNKAIYFPSIETLAISDLHLGYEQMLKSQGLQIPLNQLDQTKKEIDQIINELKNQGLPIKKIIINGDLKHYFNFEVEEKYEVRDFLEFLENYFKKENIILIKGNHDVIELDFREYKNYHIEGNIAFTHRDTLFPGILNKKIKTLVLGHAHPAIILKEKSGVKKEKYKCFLIGKWKNKETIILPSFFPFTEGTTVETTHYENTYFNKLLTIKHKELEKFRVHVVGKDKVYEFGKLGNI